jgi:hypothetical protein
MWPYLGNIISGLSLTWAIYSFVIKKREDSAEKDRKDFLNTFKTAVYLLEKDVDSLKSKLESNTKELSNTRIAVVTTHEKIKLHNQFLEENYKRIEKVLDRHENKLDSFGKVVVK